MGKSLMIVDDSATMRKIIMRTVRMSGLEFERTEEAGSGVEALEKLKAGPVDVGPVPVGDELRTAEILGGGLEEEAPVGPRLGRHGERAVVEPHEALVALEEGVEARGAAKTPDAVRAHEAHARFLRLRLHLVFKVRALAAKFFPPARNDQHGGDALFLAGLEKARHESEIHDHDHDPGDDGIQAGATDTDTDTHPTAADADGAPAASDIPENQAGDDDDASRSNSQ